MLLVGLALIGLATILKLDPKLTSEAIAGEIARKIWLEKVSATHRELTLTAESRSRAWAAVPKKVMCPGCLQLVLLDPGPPCPSCGLILPAVSEVDPKIREFFMSPPGLFR